MRDLLYEYLQEAGKPIPKGVDDGVLTAKDISQLNLRGIDLVVMSACQTGLSEVTSDGVAGLQRGFKKAGVKTLIMSLWKVDDYPQKTVREKHRIYDKPEYWAAFIMLD